MATTAARPLPTRGYYTLNELLNDLPPGSDDSTFPPPPPKQWGNWKLDYNGHLVNGPRRLRTPIVQHLWIAGLWNLTPEDKASLLDALTSLGIRGEFGAQL